MSEAGARVLIVDDEANMRTILRGLLSREGFQVDEAVDGLDAMATLARNGGDYHVIVSDLRMPGMDGMELLAHVKGAYPGRPVVMITAHGTVDTAVEAMKVGAFDFVTKPFDAEDLRAIIRKAVNTARAELDSVEPVEITALDDQDDVQKVHANFDIPDEELAALQG